LKAENHLKKQSIYNNQRAGSFRELSALVYLPKLFKITLQLYCFSIAFSKWQLNITAPLKLVWSYPAALNEIKIIKTSF